MKFQTIIAGIAASAACLLSGCTDDLNQMPVTETTSGDVYSQASNYRSVLAKIYASYVLAGQGQGGANGDLSTINGQDFSRGYFNLQEAATDEVANTWLSGNNLTDLTYIEWNSKDSWVSDTYYWLFFNISLCNEFLRHCTDSELSAFSAEEQAEIKDYRAEARFMRAFSYWMVLDLYRKGPKVDETTPVTGFIPAAYDGVSLFDFVESELKALVADNGDCLPDTNEYGRASKPTAWALLARLYLNSAVYRGTSDTGYYTSCVTACHKVISNPNCYLEPEYFRLFNADNHKRGHEILFALVCDATTSVTWGGGTYLVCGSCGNSSTQDPAKYGLSNGWGMFRARGELVAKFGDDIENTPDTRALFYTDGQGQYFTGPIDNQAEGYFYEKFTNLTDDGEAASNSAATGCSTDYPLIRLADVYLMAAEAFLRGGAGISRSEALDLVNKVRLRAYDGDESGKISDSDLTLDFILDERARELYLESVRRTDLIRFGQFTSDTYVWQWKGGVINGRAVNDRFNIYPIPDTDLTANPNLSNPLY